MTMRKLNHQEVLSTKAVLAQAIRVRSHLNMRTPKH